MMARQGLTCSARPSHIEIPAAEGVVTTERTPVQTHGWRSAILAWRK